MKLVAKVLSVVLAAAACAGCTSVTLEQYTVAQVRSAVDYRYQAALQCLAAVADHPDGLPAFGILSDGTTRILDAGSLSATTSWTSALGFASQGLGPMISRSPQESWTIDPVIDHRQLEALRCACQWALFGPDCLAGTCADLLADPEQDLSPGPHFGVAYRLARLRPGWVQFGRRQDVPLQARYQACHGHTWVWVMPEETAGLAEFTLALQDIATLDLDQGAASSPPRIVTLWVEHKTVPSLPAIKLPLSPEALKVNAKYQGVAARQASISPKLSFVELRQIKPQYLDEVQRRINAAVDWTRHGSDKVDISWDEWLVFTTPYHGPRISVASAGSLTSKAPTAGATQLGPLSAWSIQEVQRGSVLSPPRVGPTGGTVPTPAPAPQAAPSTAPPAAPIAPSKVDASRATFLAPQ